MSENHYTKSGQEIYYVIFIRRLTKCIYCWLEGNKKISDPYYELRFGDNSNHTGTLLPGDNADSSIAYLAIRLPLQQL